MAWNPLKLIWLRKQNQSAMTWQLKQARITAEAVAAAEAEAAAIAAAEAAAAAAANNPDSISLTDNFKHQAIP